MDDSRPRGTLFFERGRSMGKFIVLEGGDISGKETQARLCFAAMQRTSRTAKCAFPMYETPSGREIRRYLNGKFGDPVAENPYISALRYALNRAANCSWLWQSLQDGNVLCDRYVPSNQAFQMAKFASDDEARRFADWIEELEYDEVGLPRPHAILYFSVPVEISRQLAKNNSIQQDGHERNIAYQMRVREMYELLAKRDPKTWHVINCVPEGTLLPPDVIHAKVMEIVHGVLAPQVTHGDQRTPCGHYTIDELTVALALEASGGQTEALLQARSCPQCLGTLDLLQR